ncbi:MAG TPA: ABC transporter permease, partial [Bryobacteraceae bacterium]|nr:ABC transporter permease [Bryobacteraceae bacterium]
MNRAGPPGVVLVMNWTQDLRYALRTMRRQPWFSAAIVLTILLGIGANTTVFTLVNAALFKPLPFPGGDRLVFAGASDRSHGHDFVNVSLPDLRDFRAAQHSFERMEPFAGAQILLSDNGNAPTRLRGGEIGSGLFEMLHTPPVLGRGFNADDEKAGATQVILLGHGVWSDRYNRDPNVIGKPVRVNDKSAVIVGVMPPGFKFPNNEDAWIPAISAPDKEKRDYRNYRIIGMLRPGIGIAAATADLDVIAQRLAKQYPDAEKGLGATVQTFHQVMNGGPIRLVFLLMMGAVGFVLLIACANVANMLLSRSVAR